MQCYFLLDDTGKTITSIIASHSGIARNYAHEIGAAFVAWGNTVITAK